MVDKLLRDGIHEIIAHLRDSAIVFALLYLPDSFSDSVTCNTSLIDVVYVGISDMWAITDRRQYCQHQCLSIAIGGFRHVVAILIIARSAFMQSMVSVLNDRASRK